MKYTVSANIELYDKHNKLSGKLILPLIFAQLKRPGKTIKNSRLQVKIKQSQQSSCYYFSIELNLVKFAAEI